MVLDMIVLRIELGSPLTISAILNLHFAPFKSLFEPAGVEALADSLTQKPA